MISWHHFGKGTRIYHVWFAGLAAVGPVVGMAGRWFLRGQHEAWVRTMVLRITDLLTITAAQLHQFEQHV